MVQSTNELILGIELNEEYAQMTYYHTSVKEPLTLSRTAGTEDYLLPMALRQDDAGEWHFWDQKNPGDSLPDDRCRISGLYRIIGNGDTAPSGDGTVTAEELLAVYFRVCLNLLKVLTENAELQVMVTVRTLTENWASAITSALEQNGVSRRHIYLQDYRASFYYYAVNQKKELWNNDVALIEYEQEKINGYVLHIDRTTRPAIARVEFAAAQEVGDAVRNGRSDSEWDRERDRLFFELLKKIFERRNVTVSYLIGDYFSKSWADRSIQFLCYKRHAYQGMNLYSKGACYAALERAGMIADRGILFGGEDMVQVNLQMEMRIRGRLQMYPLVTAGANWYEVHHVCEFIPDDEREIRIISQPMAQGESVVHILRLTDLPRRQNRATRIRMTIYFTAPGRCHLEAEDLGFGEFYRPSGITWERDILF